MILVGKPTALPGSCLICGSGSREQYIDTQFSIEWHGAVFVCDTCVGEMGRLLGFLEPKAVLMLQADLEREKGNVYRLTREADGLRMAVDGLTLARGSGGVDSVPPAFVAPSVDAEEPRDGEDSVGSGESGPAEPLHDEGVAELSDDGSPISFQLNL